MAFDDALDAAYTDAYTSTTVWPETNTMAEGPDQVKAVLTCSLTLKT